MFLLDTPLLLELRKAKAGGTDAGFAAWAARVSRQKLFISALNLLEIENAVSRAMRKDKAAAARMREWIDAQLLPAFDGRILAVDAAVVRRCGALSYPDARDGLMAATALEHGLTIVTRKTTSFKLGKVRTFNPWGYRAEADEDEEDWGQAASTGPLWLKNLFVRA